MGDQILAIAGLTLREAVRRKFFLLVMVFAVLLICSAAFFPSIKKEDQLRLMQIWSLRATTIFACVLVIVVAAMSLPDEFSSRRIFNLSSKPIRKSAIFLGRFVGIGTALAIYLALTMVVSIVYIRLVGAADAELPSPKADPHAIHREFASSAEGTEVQAELGRIVAYDRGAIFWRFDALDAADFPDPVPAVLDIQIHSGYEYAGYVNVRVVRESDGEILWPPESERVRPAEEEPAGTVFCSTRVARTFGIPRDALTGPEPVRIEISSRLRNFAIYALDDSLVLTESPGSFEWNMVKGHSLIFLKAMILMTVSLAASVWLSWPVAALCAAVTWGMGAAYGRLEEGVRDTRMHIKTIEQREREAAHGHDDDGKIPTWALVLSETVTGHTLRVLPNFDEIEPDDYLLDGVDIPMSVLVDRWIGFVLFWAVPLAVGLGLMQLKEFAA